MYKKERREGIGARFIVGTLGYGSCLSLHLAPRSDTVLARGNMWDSLDLNRLISNNSRNEVGAVSSSKHARKQALNNAPMIFVTLYFFVVDFTRWKFFPFEHTHGGMTLVHFECC